MAFDFSKLRGRIKEKYGTEDRFCVDLGISRVSMSLKLSNKNSFTHKEIAKACELLSIKDEDIASYFFKKKV